MILLFKLLLAHLIGDFILQPNSWVVDKKTKKLRSKKFYYHIAIQLLIVFLLVWDWTLWKGLLLLIFIHFVIDTGKLLLQNEKHQRYYFFADQILHFGTIFIFWLAVTSPEIRWELIFTEKTLLLTTAVVFLTLPASIIIREITSTFSESLGNEDSGSLKDAGKYIGILERLLVLTFILINHWEGIGLLFAAKSVLRFGDLKESKDRKLTEYVLIGTLLSFGIAIIAGIITTSLIV